MWQLYGNDAKHRHFSIVCTAVFRRAGGVHAAVSSHITLQKNELAV